MQQIQEKIHQQQPDKEKEKEKSNPKLEEELKNNSKKNPNEAENDQPVHKNPSRKLSMETPEDYEKEKVFSFIIIKLFIDYRQKTQ